MKFFISHTSLPKNSARRRLNGCLLRGCVTPVIWIVLTLVISVAVFDSKSMLTWDWEASSGKPIPQDFYYIMFPKTSATATYDKPDGKAVGTLNRAMVNGQTELSDTWVTLNCAPAASQWVKFEELTFDPPTAHEALVAAASANYAARHYDQFAYVSFDAIPIPSGIEVHVQLRPDDDYVDNYVYTVSNGIATPVKMQNVNGKKVAFESIGNLPVSGLIAVAVLVIPVVGYRIVKQVRDRQKAFAQARSGTQAPSPEGGDQELEK